jgi:hypothetical protein
MNIHQLLQKIKQLASSDLYIVAIIILVGFAGFGLGRLSIIEESRTPVKIEYPEYLSASVLNSQNSIEANIRVDTNDTNTGLLVASISGSKYHFPWCAGAKQIKEANKIWFDSVEDARKAGYEPAGNCKGLK